MGTPVTVTLINGQGGSADWLAFAASGAPDTSYLQWVYVGSGVTTRTWTVTPATAGTFEFRLFFNDGYSRGGTSPTVTVTTPTPVLTVSSTTVTAGSAGDGHVEQRIRRIDGLAVPGRRRGAEHELFPVDLRWGWSDHAHLDCYASRSPELISSGYS